MSNQILIVEDDPIIAHDISIILQKHDYHVKAVCHNATKAIDLLANDDIDAAILDIHLGSGQNGIDVARIIHEKHPIPYIFLTSFSDTATLQAAQEQGPYGYLVKPFQEETLLTTLAIAISNFEKQQGSRSKSFTPPQAGLTDQETKIIAELLTGESYANIAEKMFISINTVRYHVKNIYAKYDVNGRAQLIHALL